MEKTKRVDTIDNLPPSRVRQVGSWTEQFSSNGRRYFYNRDTEVSQWDKPAAWIEAELIIDPDLDNGVRDNEDRDNEDRFSCASMGRESDRCGSSPEKIDVSDDENSPMEEEVDEEEVRRKALEEEQRLEEEQKALEAEREYNKYYGYRRFMDEEAMEKKYKQMFGVERPVRPYTKENYPYHLSRRVEDLNFQVEFDEKMVEASKARKLAESLMYNANFFARKSHDLKGLREELEERRINFQASFETSMGTLVAQAKREANDDDLEAHQYPEEKIVECHEILLKQRSDGYREKRARFMEMTRPKQPTPSPSPEPTVPAVAPVILDEKKLRELEVRSPSPSYEDQDMEMVVSPVFDDEYDPTARAIPSHSSRASTHSSSPGRSGANEPARTQEYNRPSTEQPLNFILDPPPPFPFLIDRASPGRLPVRSPPVALANNHSPQSPQALRSPHSPVISPVASPAHVPQSPDPMSLRSPLIEPLTSPLNTPTKMPFKTPFNLALDPNFSIPVFDPTVPPPNMPPFLPPPPPAPKLFSDEFVNDKIDHLF